ncbi:uncharacterized protein LOC113371357 [Ctenocephalides felis]|uniref:uncharacterized protein LOC113371357 n=1 Tax=Ctenocephalides felis TaxID=7515 RepID=UPI000E6E4E20|nr:uncharacterized protein LOC113371357 [Ctenocephalides felis]
MFCYFKNIPRYVALQKISYLMNIRFSVSSTTLTPLDDFTSHLVREKSEKWGRTTRQNNVIHEKELLDLPGVSNSELNIRDLTTVEIDNILLNTLYLKKYPDFNYILDQCRKLSRLPTTEKFLEAISHCSRMGLKQEVTKLDKLLLDYNPQEYENNAQLQHYHIELLWKQGNIENATHSFLDMYQKFVQLRPKVLEMSLHMIFVLVPNGSDANLVMMTKFATNFYKKFNELQPLCLTWELSFLSEWFSDQVWSKQILEQCPEILDKVKLRLLPMANHSLQKHDVDTVQRILEIMLAYNLRNSYIILLHLLFDYKCKYS